MSSPESTENYEPASSQELPLSIPHSSLSPQRPPATYGRDGRKERRNPSITPRKFTKFFTPRSSRPSTYTSSSRQALNDITAPSNNRRGKLASPIRFNNRVPEKDADVSPFPRDLKRRKLLHTPEATPEFSLPSKGHTFAVLRDADEENEEDEDIQNIHSSPCERAAGLEEITEEEDEEIDEETIYQEPLKTIVPVEERGLGGSLLRSMSGLPGRNRRQHHVYPVNGEESLNVLKKMIN
jgi:hypothetical protein